MTVYTVTIPIKNEMLVERLRPVIEGYIGAEHSKIEVTHEADHILAYRAVQGEWSSDYILVSGQDKKKLTVTLNAPCDRDPAEIGKRIPRLIAALYEEKPFPIVAGYLTGLGQPVEINISENFQGKCVEMICGRGQGALPMVYISRLPRNSDNKAFDIDPDRLAKICTGLACVVTEDSIKTSYNLKEATEGRKIYNGYIGIYYPHVKPYDFCAIREGESAAELEYRVFEVVRQWWLNSRENEYSWSRLQVIKEKQAASEEKGEARELITAFEQEIRDMVAESERLKKELQADRDKRSALEHEVERLRVAVQGKSRGCLLEMPDFDEWYTGEFADLVINILQAELEQRTLPENRAAEVLAALIEKNPIIGDGEKLFEKMAAAIREADSTEKLLSVLMRNGWTLVMKSPHAKLHFKGDPRYFATLAVSPSDWREKDNFISDVMKKINPKKGI